MTDNKCKECGTIISSDDYTGSKIPLCAEHRDLDYYYREVFDQDFFVDEDYDISDFNDYILGIVQNEE